MAIRIHTHTGTDDRYEDDLDGDAEGDGEGDDVGVPSSDSLTTFLLGPVMYILFLRKK